MTGKPASICVRCRHTSCVCSRSNISPADQRRGSSAQRGYDSNWRRFRDWFLSRHPLCESEFRCRSIATEVHHVRKVSDWPEGRLYESNCQALCAYHHRRLRGSGGRG